MKTPDLAPLDLSKVILAEAAFLDFAIKRKPSGHIEDDINGFTSHISVHTFFNVQEKGVKIEIEISCEAIDKSNELLGIEGSFTIGFTFYIENLEEHLVQAKEFNDPIPNTTLMFPLIGAAYSTARGMIIIKVLGTPLQGFTLPIANARDLLQPPVITAERKKKKH